ncbi:MAG: carbohydrate-binding domain-containing protein, partial [Candidatus Gastranaerophilales bacterium]|nr:carbohydrate-binding domain-containing protein [Candidatus Gastranaerophilales bacterium]
MKRKYLLIAIIIFVLLAGIVTTFFLLSKSDKPLNQADTHTTETVEEYNDIAWINESLAQVILNDKITKITQGGTYNIHGNGSSGIYIDTDDKIKLILNDANIINKNGSAIFIENADGVEIELADNSINHLENSPKREDDENGEGTLFSNASLSLSGNGYLSVKSNYSDAISTKKNLDILSGNYAIISENDGLKGKDS